MVGIRGPALASRSRGRAVFLLRSVWVAWLDSSDIDVARPGGECDATTTFRRSINGDKSSGLNGVKGNGINREVL